MGVRVLRLALIAGVAGLLSSAAVAEPSVPTGTSEPTTNASTTADSSANDPNKVICKNVKPPTGTRLASSRNRQRICQTKADWDQQELDAQAQAAAAINEGRNTSPDH